MGIHRILRYQRLGLILLCFAMACSFLGWRKVDPHPTPVSTTALTLPGLMASYALSLVSEPGSGYLQLKRGAHSIVLAPGLPIVVINGKSHPLPAAPRMRGGVLQLPQALTALLPPALCMPAGNTTIVLDAGHGGKDSGARSGGLVEKEVVLDIARRCARQLQARGIPVVLTRKDDRFLTLRQRSDIANRSGDAILVSIHANATSDPDAASIEGIETFVLSGAVSESYRVRKASSQYDVTDPGDGRPLSASRKRNTIARMSRAARAKSHALADAVQRSLVTTTGANDRSVRSKNLAVLRETYFGPAILTEIGFLTHPATARKLKQSAYRERIARAIADGTWRYLLTAD